MSQSAKSARSTPPAGRTAQTAGPWSMSETYHNGEPSWYAVHPCHFYFEGKTDEQTLADARLIAAAPALLAALKDAVRWISGMTHAEQDIATWKAALAHAEGRG